MPQDNNTTWNDDSTYKPGSPESSSEPYLENNSSDEPVIDEHYWDKQDKKDQDVENEKDDDEEEEPKKYVNPKLLDALHSVKGASATVAELYRATSPRNLQNRPRSPYDDQTPEDPQPLSDTSL